MEIQEECKNCDCWRRQVEQVGLCPKKRIFTFWFGWCSQFALGLGDFADAAKSFWSDPFRKN